MTNTFQISPTLDIVIERLVQGLRPLRIYLFGSQASGRATKESDFDLLVVVLESDLPRHKREAFSYDLLWGLKTPVDLIVLTEEEFNRSLDVKTSLPATVRGHGTILYHAP